MGSGRLVAVADTGPLIHLAEIECLALLTVFDELHVPDAVWREAKKPAAIRSELTFATRHTVDSDGIARFVAEKSLGRLQAGDRESLYLAVRLGIPLVLTDDLAVRKAAHDLNLVLVGSLGIIAKAFQTGRISLEAAEQILGKLYEGSSLFVTKAIVDLTIEELHGQ